MCFMVSAVSKFTIFLRVTKIFCISYKLYVLSSMFWFLFHRIVGVLGGMSNALIFQIMK